MEQQIQKLYTDILTGSIIPLYLTLMTQVEGSEDYLVSETIIWRDKNILNKIYDMFPEIIQKLPNAKKFKLDCICHTKQEHLEGMKEAGIKDVDKIYGDKI